MKISETIVDVVISKLTNSRLFKWLFARTVPRWIILALDMLIVAFSYAMLVMYDYSVGWAPVDHRDVFFAVTMVVYFCVILVSGSYKRIIRLSVIDDLLRELVVVVTATLLLMAINMAGIALLQWQLAGYMAIIFIGVISFSLLMIERLVVKYAYIEFLQAGAFKQNVLVFGTSMHSLWLASFLSNHTLGKYHTVGLLSMSDDQNGGTLNGMKVYKFDPATTANLCVEQRIYALVFNLSRMQEVQDELYDYFLSHNIKMLVMNDVDEFSPNSSANKKADKGLRNLNIEDLLGRDAIHLEKAPITKAINGNVVMVTGACGSIGSEIVRLVAEFGAKKIVLVDQAETPMHDMGVEMHNTFPGVSVVLFIGDVQNRERMEQAFKQFRPRFVFHAAAYKHVPMMELNPTEAVLTNVGGTRNVADLAVKYGVHRFVMISTDKAVNPSNVMGCTKRIAEIYTQSLFFSSKNTSGTQFVTTRFGNVLGSNGSVIPMFRKQIASGGPVTITDRRIIRYFMTINEACQLVLEAGCLGHGGQIYIFDMGRPVKILDLAKRMIMLNGLRPDVDIQIKEVGLRPGEKLYEELLADRETTTPTQNDKIMAAQVRKYDFDKVSVAIGDIVDTARMGNVHDMILEMKELVPEYKSQNSQFEYIDKELAGEGSAPSLAIKLGGGIWKGK